MLILTCRSNLFWNGKHLVASTFDTSVQGVFKGFLWFFKLRCGTFYPFPGRIFKNWIHVCFSYLKINMDKASQKVTKDPKRVEAAYKGRENYINKLKESILNDAKKGDTSNASNETTSAINTATTPATNTANTATRRSSDAYIYGVATLAVLAIGVCVFFAYNTSQAANKKQVNEKQDQPPKRRHML